MAAISQRRCSALDRGEFFSKGWTLAIGKSLELLSENKVVNKLESFAEKKQRPPGAAPSETEFRALCTGCDACMVACPVNVIMVEDMESRYPLIFPEKDPCIACEDTPCITACETGALDLKHEISGRSC